MRILLRPLLLLLPALSVAQTREGYVPAGPDVHLFYRIVGTNPDTVIVIHGGPGFTMDYFAKDLEPLAAHHTLVFYDQRGAGKSTLVSDSVGLSGDKFVDDLEAIRQYFHLRQVALLGHSWGAAVVALYAMRYPDRVARLLIVGGMPLRSSERVAVFANLDARRDSAQRAEMKKWYEARVANPGDLEACHRYYVLWFTPFFQDPASMSRSKGDFCDGTPESRRNKIQGVDRYTLQSLGDWDWRPGIGRLQAPVLVIQGSADVIPDSSAREWAATPAHGRLLLLPHVGHFSYLEAPDVFFPAADEFLRGQWPAGAVDVGVHRGSTTDLH